MKRFILLILIILCINLKTFANDNYIIVKEQEKQQYITNIGINLLNKNKVNKRIIFTYNKDSYKKTLNDTTLVKRQIIFYEEYFKYVENDDELAGFLAQSISRAVKSYSGEWGGFVGATQVKAAPKKYELFADKRAVDYMVKAGYNPLGLITFINKSAPQGIFDKLLFHNKPSVRMAVIYEYIYYNYPVFLENNEYINNKNYQNFLLTSAVNRAKLYKKIKTNSNKELKYE